MHVPACDIDENVRHGLDHGALGTNEFMMQTLEEEAVAVFAILDGVISSGASCMLGLAHVYSDATIQDNYSHSLCFASINPDPGVWVRYVNMCT